ncbi:ubiquinol oxidase subunit II, partial [Pseudomonas syringae pv. tagetis]
GVALWAFIYFIPVLVLQFGGGSMDWLEPFAMFCGLALIVAYALLGCTLLIMKPEAALQKAMHDLHISQPLAVDEVMEVVIL